jgi:hypothetical protein
MTEAKFFLVVRFSIEPQAVELVMRWLDGGQVDEVLRTPGFLCCNRVKTDYGAYLMLYGIESRAAFEAYEANGELKAKFVRERAPFEKHMRIERFCGEVEKSYAA